MGPMPFVARREEGQLHGGGRGVGADEFLGAFALMIACITAAKVATGK
jgi:hypothetical protein